MFKFIKSNGFKIKLLDNQLNQLSNMEKISKALKDKNTTAFDIDYRYHGLGYGQSILKSELT